jgi:hypothetical protein
MTNPIRPLFTNCLALFAIYYFLTPPPALGYFDLGTGTYMLQMLLGFGAAIWLSMRTSWIRFGRMRKKGTADNKESASEPPPTPAAEGAGDSEAKT